MRLLVLGGSHFVGRALVESALAADHSVDVLNRGQTGHLVPGAQLLRADRRVPGELAGALAGRSWDAVIDTWAGPPAIAGEAARILGPVTGHYGYVSSRSVYAWPMRLGADESHPVVEADPESTTSDDYATMKRGCELGVLAARPDALIARAGLIIGPYEDIGRLPWWLGRMERGGSVLAPGPATRPLQYVDARDLADWMLRCAAGGVGGLFNAVSSVGHTTMGELLEAAISVAGTEPELVWLTPEQIADAGIAPWTELPIWAPPIGEEAALHDGDSSAARRTGLRCRPILETVTDTWQWLEKEGWPEQRPDRPAVGLHPEREALALASCR